MNFPGFHSGSLSRAVRSNDLTVKLFDHQPFSLNYYWHLEGNARQETVFSIAWLCLITFRTGEPSYVRNSDVLRISSGSWRDNDLNLGRESVFSARLISIAAFLCCSACLRFNLNNWDSVVIDPNRATERENDDGNSALNRNAAEDILLTQTRA